METPTGPEPRRRRTRIAAAGVVAGAVFMVVGAGMVVAAKGGREVKTEVLGTNAPISAEARDPLSTRAFNSPTLVANPRDPSNLVVVSRLDSQPFSCGLDVSFDRGATWMAMAPPTVAGKDVTCFAPDAAFSTDGVLTVSFTTWAQVPGEGLVPDTAWVVRSSDGGRTLSAPVVAVAKPGALQVRLAADPTTAGRLYLVWLAGSGFTSWGLAEAGHPILVSRSDDGGNIWSEPVPVATTDRARVIAPSITVAPSGRVHVAYLDVGDDILDYHGAHEGRGGEPYDGPWTLVTAGSADEGRTWHESVVDPVVSTQRILQIYPPTPSLVVSPSGETLYVAFQDGRSGRPEVAVWSSGDEGRGWQRQSREAEGPGVTGRESLAALSVAPGGRLDLIYYRRAAAEDTDLRTDAVFESSVDEGRTWAAPLRLSDSPFDAGVGVGSDRDMPSLGSRLAVLSTDSGALGVWTDTRAGTVSTGKQDLARAVVRVTDKRASPGTGRAVGAGIAVLGLLLLAASGWSLRSRPSPAV